MYKKQIASGFHRELFSFVNNCNNTDKNIKVFKICADISSIHNNSSIGKDMICR